MTPQLPDGDANTEALGTASDQAVPAGPEVMSMEQVAAISELDKKELVSLIVELIERDPEVRGAVMRCAYNTPGIVVEY